MSQYLDTIRDRVVFYDGSMGATILNMQLTPEQYGGKEGCNDYLTIVQPDIIESIHASFMEAGADVLETDTFGGSLIKLEEYGLGELHLRAQSHGRRTGARRGQTAIQHRRQTALRGRLDRPDRSAARVGRSDAGQPPLRRGGGPLPRSDARSGGRRRRRPDHRNGAGHPRAEGGHSRRARRSSGERDKRVPIQASITLDTSGRMLLGTDIAAALTILEHLPVDVIGLNCVDGPGAHARAGPLPGRELHAAGVDHPERRDPDQVNGLAAISRWSRSRWAAELREMVEEFGVGIVGGCCGTTPGAHPRRSSTQIGRRAAVRAPDVDRRRRSRR